MTTHQPVLLKEAIHYLNVKPDGKYIDGTFGRGGHARQILERLGENGKLLAIDKDPAAIQIANSDSIFQQDSRFQIKHGSFSELYAWAEEEHWVGKVDGILLDLGVSSPQLDEAERGFSFLKEGPLDMRMNPEAGLDAATWINTVKEATLAEVLKEYGEERFAKRISSAIVQARKKKRITTTTELAEIIKLACPTRERKKHPATRSFQGIRIFINHELDELHTCLSQCTRVLAAGGRLVVISFHSLEDRIVKQFMKAQEKVADLDNKYAKETVLQGFQRITKKAVRPEWPEVRENPRARSAILRVLEKIA